jgi:molybdopterin synthase catalytic subunit
LPLYNPFSQVLPVLNECCDHLKANAATWKTYIETEDDKKVYIKKLAKNKLDNIVENEDSDYSNNEE